MAWKIGASIVLVLLLVFVTPSLLSHGARERAVDRAIKLYQLAERSDYESPEARRLASPHALRQFAEMDRTFGRVQSFAIIRTVVQVTGMPTHVHLRVTRKGISREEHVASAWNKVADDIRVEQRP